MYLTGLNCHALPRVYPGAQQDIQEQLREFRGMNESLIFNGPISGLDLTGNSSFRTLVAIDTLFVTLGPSSDNASFATGLGPWGWELDPWDGLASCPEFCRNFTSDIGFWGG